MNIMGEKPTQLNWWSPDFFPPTVVLEMGLRNSISHPTPNCEPVEV